MLGQDSLQSVHELRSPPEMRNRYTEIAGPPNNAWRQRVSNPMPLGFVSAQANWGVRGMNRAFSAQNDFLGGLEPRASLADSLCPGLV